MKRWGRIIAGLGICAAVMGAAAPFVWMKDDTAMPGLRVNGIAVGGMNKSQLAAMREEKNAVLSGLTLTAHHGDVKEEWAFKDISVRYDETLDDRIMAEGRTGHLAADWLTRWKSLLSGDAIHVDPSYDEQALTGKVRQMAGLYGKDAESPMPVFNADGTVTLKPGRTFLKIDTEKLKEAVANVLRSGEAADVAIPVTEEKNLNLSLAECKEINAVLGKYTTYFGGNPNRSRNIKIAADTMSGWVVRPGETFSFNETTGERAPEKGYLDAPVIVAGKAVPGVGGGVCQASSTLFNAAMLAGLEITNRTEHFSPVSYVPIGQDATVSFGSLDFCFRNHLKHPIYIYAEATDSSISIWILGNEEDEPEIASVARISGEDIPFKEVTVIDPSQKEDKTVEEGHLGYLVTIRQAVRWKDGRTYEDTFTSRYDPVDTVITLKKEPKKKEDPSKDKDGKAKQTDKTDTKAKTN